MKDVIVILRAEDIPGALQICADLTDYEVFLFDPGLGDAVVASGLRNIELFTALGAGPSYVSLDQDAHAAALALETELDAVQCALTGVSILGWQHLNLYYLFLTLLWYANLWERMGHRLVDRRIYVLMHDNPGEYYFNSFLPSLSLVSHLTQRGTSVTAYDYGAKGPASYLVPDLRGEAHEGAAECLLIHLATSFQDIGYFRDEILATGKSVINVRARYWDVPTGIGEQIGLVDTQIVLATLPAADQEVLDTFTRVVTEKLDRVLTPHIGLPYYRTRQVDHIVQLFRSQLVTYFGLHRFFRTVAPAELLVSEHDSGFTGPLLSFAARRSLPAIMLAHSKASDDLTFTCPNVLVLTHPMQAMAIHDVRGEPVAHQPMSYPEHFSGTSVVGNGLRTISLLLNAQSLITGVLMVPTDLYLEGIKRIVIWCRVNGVNLKIRSRPGHRMIAPLKVYAGVEANSLARNLNETLEEHARDCDLCLMYDMPTMGALVFLRNSIPVLNPVVAAPAAGFLANAHPSVVVTESLDATLERLQGFIDEPLTLDDFRAAQFLAYLSLFQNTRPLRTFIGSRIVSDMPKETSSFRRRAPAIA